MSVCLVTIRQHHEAECQSYGCEAIEFFSSMGRGPGVGTGACTGESAPGHGEHHLRVHAGTGAASDLPLLAG